MFNIAWYVPNSLYKCLFHAHIYWKAACPFLWLHLRLHMRFSLALPRTSFSCLTIATRMASIALCTSNGNAHIKRRLFAGTGISLGEFATSLEQLSLLLIQHLHSEFSTKHRRNAFGLLGPRGGSSDSHLPCPGKSNF
jgi:hypothetical protein